MDSNLSLYWCLGRSRRIVYMILFKSSWTIETPFSWPWLYRPSFYTGMGLSQLKLIKAPLRAINQISLILWAFYGWMFSLSSTFSISLTLLGWFTKKADLPFLCHIWAITQKTTKNYHPISNDTANLRKRTLLHVKMPIEEGACVWLQILAIVPSSTVKDIARRLAIKWQ